MRNLKISLKTTAKMSRELKHISRGFALFETP